MARWTSTDRRALARTLAAGLLAALLLAARLSFSTGQPAARRALHASPPRQTSQTHRATPTQVLRLALSSAARVAFSGEQTVLTFDERDGAFCVTQETHLGSSRHRIVFQYPLNARGQIQIADGKRRLLYLPHDKTIIESVETSQPLTAANVKARLARIQKHYLLRLSPRLETVAERPAYRLDIVSRRQDRPWQRLWIDRATGLTLRRECYRPDGAQISVSSWRNLRFYPQPTQLSLRWKPPPGTKTHRSSSERVLFRLAEARKQAGSWATLPADLGKGFQFESARLVSVKGARGLYCQYSDGLNSVSLVQTAAPRLISASSPDDKQVRSIRIGNQAAQIASRGFLTVLSWEHSSRSITLSLIGEIAESTLVSIAQTLQ